MKKKTLLIYTLLLFTHLSAFSEVLIIEQKDGSKAIYDLGDNPVLTYEGSKLKVKATNAEASFELMKVKKGYFKADVTGTEALQNSTSTVVVATENGVLIKNDAPNKPVSVYTAKGVQIGAYTTDQAGNLEIELGNAPAGIILVKTATTTIKLIKK